MTAITHERVPALDELVDRQDGVLSTGAALRYMTGEALQWRVRTGRWQQPCRGIVVTHSGELSSRQRLWVASLWAGPGSVLGGLTAARLDGFKGFTVRPEHLAAELDRRQQINRRVLMRATVADIAGGSHALSELDLLNFVVRPFGLPEPDRQASRRDACGRRRWLDAMWKEAKVIVEIDGAAHADVRQYWDDMDRDNGFRLQGYTTLRYASFMVRSTRRTTWQGSSPRPCATAE